MAPPEHTFPSTSLPTEAQLYTEDYKTKSRKFPDFDLKKCELFQMLQYSCDPMMKQEEDPTMRVECEPIQRLFRRCGEPGKRFSVETTAWEGFQGRRLERQRARKEIGSTSKTAVTPSKEAKSESDEAYATIGSYFWSNPTK